ncbi:MAG: hypothetical protein HC817_01400 [Saprospiraceae bacterium]|nr:hypothetical protein [Saprospiraceae bacterium]
MLDTVAPVVRCRAATVFLDREGKGSLDFRQIDNGTSDNCGIETFILSKAAFDCANLGNNLVTLTAVDKHENRSRCTAQVTVRDTITPSVFCPKIRR